MQLHETLDAASARICADGCLVADVKAARTGIQVYSGREVDPDNAHGFRDKAEVRVYRSEQEVFSRDSMASYAAAPLTINHPPVMVDSANWRDYGRGEVNGDVVRDGEAVRLPIIFRDKLAVETVNSTHKQLSAGYSCQLDFTPGEFNGETYDAIQRDIRINHIAAVRSARGGPELRIVDERTVFDSEAMAMQHMRAAASAMRKMMGDDPTPAQKSAMREIEAAMAEMSSGKKTKMGDHDVKTITLDGLKVDLSDAEAVQAVIAKLQGQASDAETRATTAETASAALTTDKATLEAKVTTLEKQVVDAVLTPAKLRDAAKSYQAIVDKAKALGVEVGDDADEAAVMKAVVDAKMGDAAKDWSPEQIATSFATLTKDAKADEKHDPIRMPTVTANDAAVEKAYDEMVANLRDASKPKIAA